MFTELYDIVATSEKLTLELSKGPDGTMKVVIIPAAGKNAVPALSMPLAFCNTPAELDAGFAQAIKNYQAPRIELQKQVELTATLLGKAKADEAASALKALEQQKGKPNPAGKKNTPDADDDDEGVEGDDSNAGDDSPAPAVSTQESQVASGKTNLADYFE